MGRTPHPLRSVTSPEQPREAHIPVVDTTRLSRALIYLFLSYALTSGRTEGGGYSYSGVSVESFVLLQDSTDRPSGRRDEGGGETTVEDTVYYV